MSGVPEIPQNMEDWNIDVLNKLVEYRDIESESFDFKGNVNDLVQHFCAMANTTGGFLVLGVDEIENNGHIIRFEKKGFRSGEEDNIGKEIGNSAFHIEPFPKISVKNLPENDRFYTVIKVIAEESKKPYMIRERGQFYVRFNNSNKPASRATILNLFTDVIQRRTEVRTLRNSFNHLKESILLLSKLIDITTHQSNVMLPPVDVSFVKSSAISAEWFLAESNLLERQSNNQEEVGFYEVMYDIEILKIYIQGFNDYRSPHDRQPMIDKIKLDWVSREMKARRTIDFLNRTITLANDFLNKP